MKEQTDTTTHHYISDELLSEAVTLLSTPARDLTEDQVETLVDYLLNCVAVLYAARKTFHIPEDHELVMAYELKLADAEGNMTALYDYQDQAY